MTSPIDVTLLRVPESARPAVLEAFEETPTSGKSPPGECGAGRGRKPGCGDWGGGQSSGQFRPGTHQPALRLGLQCIPCQPQLRMAPLNTIEQTLLDKGSPVYQKLSLATVVLWRIEELLPEVLLHSHAVARMS